jgi:hypothetical protein
MGSFCKTGFSVRILLLAGLMLTTPAAAATFDGEWNVQIASSSAACSSGAYRSRSGSASARVSDVANISLTLASGLKRAVGLGRLTGTSGSGTWRAALCSGTWTAQRI